MRLDNDIRGYQSLKSGADRFQSIHGLIRESRGWGGGVKTTIGLTGDIDTRHCITEVGLADSC